MATPAGQFRPGRLIAIFVGITAVLYALVFFTPGSNAPRLGIDLQGGTRITLTAKTEGGATPSSESMAQARSILETRVNGSGVAGAQVQIDGATQLVVTVPGNRDIADLTRTAQLNIRETLGQGYDLSGVPVSSGASGTGSGTASSQAPTTLPAIGDTTAPATPSPAATIGNKPSGSVGTTASKSSSTTASAATGASSAAASNGLRRAAAATTTPSAATGSAATGAAASGPAATNGTTSSSPASTVGSATTGTVASTGSAAAGGTGTASATGTAATGTAASTAAAAWPLPGSDPKNPNQPAAKDAAGWAAWVTAATNAVQANQVKCADLEPTRGQDDPNRPLLSCGANPLTADQASSPCSAPTTVCVLVLDKTLIPGNEIDNAAAAINSSGAGWVINMSFKSSGYNTWVNYTTNNTGKQTAFDLDGQVISQPQVNEAITTTVTQISGNFTQASATALANSLKFGALPIFFTQDNSQNVSAQLGLEYLQAGLIAGGIGLLLVIVYCLIYYRLLGVITILSLVLSFGLVYGVMVLLGRWISLSLDMAGIAGLIVAIGITADSFVIYFERLKDEVREGRSFRSAVPRGWERAKRTILSADAVSFLSALVLYLIAVGDVRGFAFTLGLSTVLDLVVVYLVTHPLVALASGAKIFQSQRFSGLGAVAQAGAQQRAATARLAPKEA